jgi:hypothetical protein
MLGFVSAASATVTASNSNAATRLKKKCALTIQSSALKYRWFAASRNVAEDCPNASMAFDFWPRATPRNETLKPAGQKDPSHLVATLSAVWR